jgi:predicted metal-binding membrane protein
MNHRTALELLLLRDRWLLGGSLVLVILLCWAWIGPMAFDMYGTMTGSSAWMMTKTWDLPHQALLFGMWEAMMIGMMLPSAIPALFLYGSLIRKSPEGARAAAHVYAFATGYLLIWSGFSLFATGLQLLLNNWLLLSPMMETRTRWFGGGLLAIAGIYQLTPYKRACLESCRFPLEFMTRHWKTGLDGGLRMGIGQGAYCLGCCWALMLLLFVGGVMNLWWIGALTIFVFLERLAPLGRGSGLLSGMLIIALAVWTFVTGHIPR